VDAAGHEVVAGALGRAATQERCFHIDETALVEVAADDGGHAVAEEQRPLQAGAAQVEPATGQADILARQFLARELGHLEGWSRAGVEHLHRFGEHLDRAGGEVGVLLARQSLAHHSGDGEAPFPAEAVRLLKYAARARFRLENDLRDTVTVPQVDEDLGVVGA